MWCRKQSCSNPLSYFASLPKLLLRSGSLSGGDLSKLQGPRTAESLGNPVRETTMKKSLAGVLNSDSLLQVNMEGERLFRRLLSSIYTCMCTCFLLFCCFWGKGRSLTASRHRSMGTPQMQMQQPAGGMQRVTGCLACAVPGFQLV